MKPERVTQMQLAIVPAFGSFVEDIFINTKKAFEKLYMFYFETFRIILNPSSVNLIFLRNERKSRETKEKNAGCNTYL